MERYLTIARTLTSEIAGGKLAPGAALPGRLELARRFETGRGTVDRAVRLLSERGVVRSRRGAGTYVNPMPRARLALVGEHPPPLPDHPFVIDTISPASLERRGERERLRAYDGVLWYLPRRDVLPWLDELSGPHHLVLNRELPDVNFVTTDHHGALKAITSERLQAHPDATPVFLRGRAGEMVAQQREAGFVDACRTADCFYESWSLPESFGAAVASLDKCLNDRGGTLLLFSASLQHTGAVMAWARAGGRRWGEDTFYTDFDNCYPANVWGVTVTSFLQDYPQLLAESLSRMEHLIAGACAEVQVRLLPRRRNGDT